MEQTRCTAVILAAGRGSRMGTKIQKQYLELAGRPVLCYSLQAFQQSAVITDVILVAGEAELSFCRDEIVSRYGYSKVRAVIPGGAQRYDSVWAGLRYIHEKNLGKSADAVQYVFIHDGARPFVDEAMIDRTYKTVCEEKACVVGMPVKDTIKIADDNGYAQTTPDRSKVWMVQTPQAFELSLIYNAYEKIIRDGADGVTDDAMAAERASGIQAKLVEGSYQNIKITTPEDLEIARMFLNR